MPLGILSSPSDNCFVPDQLLGQTLTEVELRFGSDPWLLGKAGALLLVTAAHHCIISVLSVLFVAIQTGPLLQNDHAHARQLVTIQLQSDII